MFRSEISIPTSVAKTAVPSTSGSLTYAITSPRKSKMIYEANPKATSTPKKSSTTQSTKSITQGTTHGVHDDTINEDDPFQVALKDARDAFKMMEMLD